MPLPNALSYLLKRVEPGQLKKTRIKTLANSSPDLTAHKQEVLDLIDLSTGYIKPEYGDWLARIARRSPALFSGIAVSSFVAPVEGEESPDSQTPEACPDGNCCDHLITKGNQL